LGYFLNQNGIQFNDKVGFLLDNSYASVLLFLGSMYHGATIVPINILAGNNQIEYTINHSECKLLLTSKLYFDKFESILEGLEASVFVYEKVEDLYCSSEDNLNSLKGNLSSDTPAVLIYTSGTTGLPKGVMLSHQNVIAGGRNTVLAHEISSNDVSLCVLPLYHINAEMVSISSALVSNSCVVIISKFMSE